MKSRVAGEKQPEPDALPESFIQIALVVNQVSGFPTDTHPPRDDSSTVRL